MSMKMKVLLRLMAFNDCGTISKTLHWTMHAHKKNNKKEETTCCQIRAERMHNFKIMLFHQHKKEENNQSVCQSVKVYS